MTRDSTNTTFRRVALAFGLCMGAVVFAGLVSRDASRATTVADDDAFIDARRVNRAPSSRDVARTARGDRSPSSATRTRPIDAPRSTIEPSSAHRDLPAPAIKPATLTASENGTVSRAGVYARAASPTQPANAPDAGALADFEASASFDPTFSERTVVGNARVEDRVRGVTPIDAQR